MFTQDVQDNYVHGQFQLVLLLQHLKFGVEVLVVQIAFAVQHQCVAIKDKLVPVAVIQK
jgi:hypothetical protein